MGIQMCIRDRQEARVLMNMEKRKPSMVGAPGTPLHTMTLEGCLLYTSAPP